MRRIVMFNRITPEGQFASQDGSMDWFVSDQAIDKSGAEGTASSDAFMFGRKTYEMFSHYWPHALEESTPPPHGNAQKSAEHRAMAVALNEQPKLVFSRTLREATWKNTRLIRQFDAREIEAIKQEPGKNIVVLGSGSIVSLLTQHGLIDDYEFVVSPVLLGKGQPLFRELSKRVKLQLVDATKHASGNVALRYSRAT